MSKKKFILTSLLASDDVNEVSLLLIDISTILTKDSLTSKEDVTIKTLIHQWTAVIEIGEIAIWFLYKTLQ